LLLRCLCNEPLCSNQNAKGEQRAAQFPPTMSDKPASKKAAKRKSADYLEVVIGKGVLTLGRTIVCCINRLLQVPIDAHVGFL
jgi:hypothetical protein